MDNSAQRVLAVGSVGKFASLVVPELARRGTIVRGLVRHEAQIDQARRNGALEVVVADLRNASSMSRALEGVHAVFYISPAGLPDEQDVGVRIVETARSAGVRQFVFSSVIHPSLSKIPHHIAKVAVEEAVLASGMEYTILQPAMFFQNFAGSWANVVAGGVLAEPWSADTKFTRVDYRDVAEVAAIAVTENQLLNGTFELCAEGRLDRHAVAALIGEVLGRPIAAKKLDLAALGPAASSPEISALKPMFAWYDEHGLWGNALVLRTILGRTPRTLLAYFQELAAQ